ncbi:DSCAM [Mytilus edulis]|uniref:DSCAM n=1 Tax=Mytilus edulis TaxID=6550 RepID=A0A8S3QH74_MYTED|nr:DSCAM [Mytilus edulis]
MFSKQRFPFSTTNAGSVLKYYLQTNHKIEIKPQHVNLTEGLSGMICCEWTSNPPGFMTMWLKNDRTLQRENDNQKYPPKVTVKYKLGTNYIDFTCSAAGEPTRYIFSQWVHKSEFHQLIFANGTRLGTLRVNRTKNPLKQFEDSGYYICRVSNGITDTEGNCIQEGTAFCYY